MQDVLSYDELKSVILDAGVVEEKDLLLAEERFHSEGGTFSQAILWYNLISDEELGRLVADFLKLPFVVLEEKNIPEEVLHTIPEIIAKKKRVIPFALDQNGLHLAMTDPKDLETQNFIEKKVGLGVKVYFVSERDFENALSLYKKDVSRAFEDLIISDIEEVGNKKVRKMIPLLFVSLIP